MKRTNLVLPKASPLFEVLKTIRDNGVSAVGLVEEDGKLGGNFSVTNLTGKWTSVSTPAFEFLQEVSPASLNSICVTLNSTLLDVCKEMTSNSIHRVWVIDEDFKPIGLISATDVFKVVRDFTSQ